MTGLNGENGFRHREDELVHDHLQMWQSPKATDDIAADLLLLPEAVDDSIRHLRCGGRIVTFVGVDGLITHGMPGDDTFVG
jgi:hypothetical protein